MAKTSNQARSFTKITFGFNNCRQTGRSNLYYLKQSKQFNIANTTYVKNVSLCRKSNIGQLGTAVIQ